MKYCPNCRRETDENMLFCMECGTKLQEKVQNTEQASLAKGKKTEKPANPQWVWILVVAIFMWAMVMTALFIDANEDKDYYYDEYITWKEVAKDMEDDARELREQVKFMDNYVVLVFDDGSDYYHTYECYKKYDGSFWAYNINAAEGKDYKPCPDCH